MPLAPGTRIGHYDVIGSIGAGGMGEVYRARDTQLHREVALKILPLAFASDPDRDARFTREAQTLAALNHPAIAQIYGVQNTGELRALVMELVAGEDLSARIARGALPVEEALRIARQIADALDAAHSAGIVHRDLKPANVKIRPDDTVKVLDFGLAKGSADSGDLNVSHSPTFTSPAMTQAGVILGTAAYMSPEQARGKPVDKRTDIWAFGCLLFEMLTGRPAFDGETVTDVLGGIVKSEPDWSALAPHTPAGIRKLLKRCLQKDASKRLRDIGDARAEIDDIATDAPERLAVPPAAPAAVSSGRPAGRVVVAWAASLVIVSAAAAAIAIGLRPTTAGPRLQKLTLAIDDGGAALEPVISPDGRRVAYVEAARSTLFVRALDQWTARELDGTLGAVRPFWSPDGQWLAFIRNEQLLKVPAAGGPVVRVASLPAVQAPLRLSSGTWTADGFIIVSLGPGVLLRVPAAGGSVVPIAGAEAEGGLLRDVHVLPNGKLLVVISRREGRDALAVLDNGTLRVIHEGEVRHPMYSPPGVLIFDVEDDTAGLWAAPFSLDRLALTGEPILIGEGRTPSVARDGTLAFLPHVDARQHLSWFTLDGRVGPALAEPSEWIEGAALSPDGRRVLASTSEGIWSYDTTSGARSRVTTAPADITPKWLDADTILFVRTENAVPVLMSKELAPPGIERVLARFARFPTLTRDRQRIVFNIRDESAQGVWNIGWIDLDRPTEIRRVLGQHRGARFPSVSPDGTLVAYVSGEMGNDEIFLTRIPNGDGKWQLSVQGGGWAQFHPNGRSVIYRGGGNLISVPVTGGADVQVGKPQVLFRWSGTWAPWYELTPDGLRGVSAIPMSDGPGPSGISIVQNWFLEFPPADAR